MEATLDEQNFRLAFAATLFLANVERRLKVARISANNMYADIVEIEKDIKAWVIEASESLEAARADSTALL
jgi:hypothetical protein